MGHKVSARAFEQVPFATPAHINSLLRSNKTTILCARRGALISEWAFSGWICL